MASGFNGKPGPGRPKGRKNKISDVIRKNIEVFLNKEFKNIERDWRELRPSMRVKMFAELLPFVIPKQSTQTNLNFDQFTESQLDEILDTIKKNYESHRKD